MTTPGSYSAGSIFLQVIPSYRDFMNNLRRDAKDIERALQDELQRQDGIGSPLDTPKSKAKRKKGAETAAREDASAYADEFDDAVGDVASPLENPKTKRRRKKAAAVAGEEEAAEYAGRFRDTLQKSLARAERELKPIEIRSNAPEIRQQVDDLKVAIAEMRKLADDTNIDLDSKDVHEGLVELEADFKRLKRSTEDLEEGINLDATEKAISGLRKEVEAFRTEDERAAREAAQAAEKEAVARDRAAAAAERQAEAVRKKAEADRREREGATMSRARDALGLAQRTLPNFARPTQRGSEEEWANEIRDRAGALADKTIGVDIDSAAYWAEYAEIMGSARLLDALTMDPDVRLDARQFHSAMAEVYNDVHDIDGKTGKVRVEAEGAKKTSQHLDSLANNLRAFNGLILAAAAIGPLLVPVLAALTAGAIGLGAAFAAVGVGIGAMILGFSGIGDAVGAINDVQSNSAKDALAASKLMRSASNGVRDAQRGIDRAYQSAADAREDSAKRIESALRDQQRAEEDLQDAQRDAERAQDRLTKARQQASEQLEDMALKARGGALAERQALIDLFEAEVAYRATMADPGATNLEQEQASINLERQRIGIEQVRQDNARLAAEQAENATQDIERTDVVIQAREGVEAANERVADAEQRAGDAARNVADARVAAARSERDSMQSIEDAQLRMADAQAAYADALVQANELGSASVQKLNDAMGKLGPAGQSFAIFIAGLKDEFFTLRNAVQEGLLPGVQRAIEILLPYLPQITAFLSEMGTVLGDLFVKAAETFTSPVWLDFFRMLDTYAPTFMTLFGETLLVFMTIFAQLATAFAPLALEMAEGLKGILEQFSAFLASPEGQQMLLDFMNYVRDAGPVVMDLLGSLFLALLNLAIALAPYAGVLAQIFIAVLDFIANMDPKLLGALAVGLLLAVVAFQALFGLFGMIGAIAGAVAGLVALSGLLAGFGPLVLAAVASFITIIAAVVAVAAVLVIAYFKFEWFRNGVNAVFNAIWEVVKFVIDAIVWYFQNILFPIWNAWWEVVKFVGGVVLKVFEIIGAAFGKLVDWISGKWDDFMNTGAGKWLARFWQDTVLPAWEGAVDIIQGIWDRITGIFSKGVEIAVDIVNNGIIDPINWLAEQVGVDPLRRIPPPKPTGPMTQSRSGGGGVLEGFATGGWTGPGSKYQPAGIVHADEFVVRKESQRAMSERFPGLLDYINKRGTLPGYAGGGLVDFGRVLQGRGFRVAEHPAFGGVRGRHAKNSRHYSGQAIDVNFGPGGTSKIETDAINAILGLAKEYGLETIWQVAGHFDHAHFQEGGKSWIGSIAGAVKGLLDKVVGGPVGYLKDKILGLPGVSTLKESPLGRLFLGPVQNAMGWGVDWLKDKASALGDFFTGGDGDEKPTLYDQGGWLPPGMSTVLNATGRPEPIFSPDQWDLIAEGGMGGSGDHIDITVDGDPDPEAVADAVMFAKRHLSRGGVYAGRR